MSHALKGLYIYLTESCNLQCTHCFQSAPDAALGRDFLAFERCQSFLDAARDLGLESVILSGGEPLLSPDFQQFAEYFYAHGISCTLETNGMLISGVRLKTIERTRVCCAVSIDGRKDVTHDAQRGRAGAFTKAVAGLRALEQAGLDFEIVMSVSKVNYGELVPLLNWLRDDWQHCIFFKINIILPSGRAAMLEEDGLLFRPADLVRISEEVGALAGGYPFKVLLHVEPAFVPLHHMSAGFCGGGHCGYRNALSILADGTVSICSLGKMSAAYTFGQVDDIDVHELWENNVRLKEIHDGVETRLQGVCGQCVFRKKCAGGCRAHALLTYGDFFAPAPMCQAYYDSGAFPKSRLIPISPAPVPQS
jgi:SynChlorMet cassette radical SAM/SPASM protein ScmF